MLRLSLTLTLMESGAWIRVRVRVGVGVEVLMWVYLGRGTTHKTCGRLTVKFGGRLKVRGYRQGLWH